MDKLVRMSLDKYGGQAPPEAVQVDERRRWFTIKLSDLPKVKGGTGPAPTQIRQNIPTVIRESKDVFPCVHRGNHIGDTPCGGCGGHKYVEVYACAKHTQCVVSRQPKDHRIKRCAGCDDRSVTVEVPFSSFKNKFDGQAATIIGRGETAFKDDDLAKIEGPIFFLNDAVQLEKHCLNNPNTFFLAQDAAMAKPHDDKPAVISGIRSVAVVPVGLGLAFEIKHKAIPHLGPICWTVKSERGEEYLLDLTRDELELERRLYRPTRSPTICSAIHFAWYCGCKHIQFIRCDGHPTPYAADLENRSNSPIVPHQYPQTKIDAELVATKLGMTFEYLGTPVREGPKIEVVERLSLAFTSTEVDAGGRAMLNDRCWSSLRHIEGLNLKDHTLYLNVDHVIGGIGPEPTIKAAEKHFGKVVCHYAEKPDFAMALKWCLLQPDTEFIWHFESDWLINEPVHIQTLVGILRSSNLTCLNLRAYNFRQDDTRICLSPGLWKSADAKVIASRLEAGHNPEKQLRRAGSDNPFGGKHDGFIGKQYPDDRNAKMVIDVGRSWISGTQYRRPNNDSFVTWEKR